MPAPAASRRVAAVLVKAAISVTLIGLVLAQSGLGAVTSALAALPAWSIAAALACMLGQIPLAGWRWWRICRGLGHDLPLGAVQRAFAVGIFFNQVLPSSVGGDVVRVWLLRRHGLNVGEAGLAVLIDRLSGLAALAAIALGGLAWLPALAGSEAMIPSLAAGLAAIPAAFVLLALLAPRLTALAARTRAVAFPAALAMGIRRLTVSPRDRWPVLAASLAMHGMTVVAAWVLARGMGLPIALIDLGVVMPPVLLLTILPVSVAGWGIREGGLVVGLGAFGIASGDALALGLALGLGTLITGLPGGILLALRPGPDGRGAIALGRRSR